MQLSSTLSVVSHLFSVFAFVKEIEFDGEIFLGFIYQPLEFEVGEQPAHDLDAIFHRCDVDFSVAAHIVMLNFHCNFFTVLQGGAVNLG